MKRMKENLRQEDAGILVESVIILPMIFVVIFFLIVSSFIMYDRSLMESSARRGVIYAAHCISDPSYSGIVSQNGELDLAKNAGVDSFSFSNLGKNVHAYRYLTGGPNVESITEEEVKKIVDKSRIVFGNAKPIKVQCEQTNALLCQNVTVSIDAEYNVPKIYELFGLETDYKYTSKASISTTDPDEFIRNADLVVDMITRIDDATGGHLQKVTDKISVIGDKIQDWLTVDDGK